MKPLAVKARTGETGSAAVEFALVAMLFFTIVFATLELARAQYLLNTLEEVTRRAAAAAANVDYRDSGAMDQVRANAVFRTSPGPLLLGKPVTTDNVVIDYLSVSKSNWEPNHMNTLPASPAGNKAQCMNDPNAANCIRFVRARICASMDTAGHCTPLPYQMMFPFFDLSGMTLPVAETIVPAGNLGAILGTVPQI